MNKSVYVNKAENSCLWHIGTAGPLNIMGKNQSPPLACESAAGHDTGV